MKKTIKGGICLFLAAVLLCICWLSAFAAEELAPINEGGKELGMQFDCRAAILMDAKTGAVLFEQNPDEALPPASVTKIMTLLLVMEAVDSGKIALSDPVTVSANAASMGGSQVFLKEGETMSVEEMLKCVVIASANDCAVALAEHVAGSEARFVEQMNARAASLGMVNTHFENTNGLDDTVTAHLTSARDIAIMSRELIGHKTILKYSGIWMDTIRDGAFGLTNTNRLVRFYRGCTGLKTGSTAKAKFCVSVTAEREGLSLICVVMAANSRDERNAIATKLLDFGFANYATLEAAGGTLEARVTGGKAATLTLGYPAFSATVPKGATSRVEKAVELPETIAAPVEAGREVGQVIYTLDGKELGRVPITASSAVEKMDIATMFWRLLQKFLLC